ATAQSLLVAALAGAAVAGGVAFLLREPPAAHPAGTAQGDATAATLTPATASGGSDAAAIAELRDRGAALQSTVAAIDRKLDAAAAVRERAAPDAAAAGVDPAVLVRAVETAQANAERAKFEAMKPGEVLESATELVNTRKDLGKARQMLEDLLHRQLTPEDRQ